MGWEELFGAVCAEWVKFNTYVAAAHQIETMEGRGSLLMAGWAEENF